jgi:hypothetical protein
MLPMLASATRGRRGPLPPLSPAAGAVETRQPRGCGGDGANRDGPGHATGHAGHGITFLMRVNLTRPLRNASLRRMTLAPLRQATATAAAQC